MQPVFWREIEMDCHRLRPVYNNDNYNGLGLRSCSSRIDEILTLFLNRTRAELLSFTLFQSSRHSLQKNYDVRRIIQALLEHSRQWDRVSI